VTVGDEIVSAAVFHNSRDYRSNLARGGGAIALTGPGRNARLLPHETSLLKRIGIEPHSRRVPSQVKQMAGKIGRHYARRGVQMLGQDFVVDAKSRWYFIEVNTAFGLAVFNVTDGNGTPTSRGVVGVAGRVLAEAFERRSDCRRGGSNCARAPSDAPPWSAADPSS
jgi:hypothetical protein